GPGTRLPLLIPLLSARRLAEIRPHDLGENCRAALRVRRLAGNLKEAKLYIQRARALATPEQTKRNFECAAMVELFPATEFWLQDDIEKALAEAVRVEQTLASRAGGEAATFAVFTGLVYQDLGRLRKAEALFGYEPNRAFRHWHMANLALDRRDQSAFEKHAREMCLSPGGTQWLGAAIFCARAGLSAEAEASMRWHENRPAIGVLRGELALARGQRTEAEAWLRKAFEATRALHRTDFVYAVDSFARALEERGEWEAALQVLEEGTRRKEKIALILGARQWINWESRRAQVLRKLGRNAEARPIEAELRRLLAYADPDHPLLAQLNQGERTATQ
ncbi:MAG: hypothetical protein ACRD35_08650, partial [Candidatus Acidiferrales bacterium]